MGFGRSDFCGKDLVLWVELVLEVGKCFLEFKSLEIVFKVFLWFFWILGIVLREVYKRIMGVRGREVDKVYWVFSFFVGVGMVVEVVYVRGDIMLVVWVVIDIRSYFCGFGFSFRSGEDVGVFDIEVLLVLDR